VCHIRSDIAFLSPPCTTIKPDVGPSLSSVAPPAFSPSHSFCRLAILPSHPFHHQGPALTACYTASARPVLGALVICSQKPQLRLWPAFDPTLTHTFVVTSCAHPPLLDHLPRRQYGSQNDVHDVSSHLRYQLPARVLALKSTSVLLTSRPPEAID
jgi:hypothetical protein